MKKKNIEWNKHEMYERKIEEYLDLKTTKSKSAIN